MLALALLAPLLAAPAAVSAQTRFTEPAVTWLGEAPPSFGTRGVPSASNWPPARFEHAMAASSNGDIFVHGGGTKASILALDTGHLNDLWRFSPATGQWTWLSGNADSPAPKMGVPTATSWPHTRRQHVMWADDNGVVFVFGGVYLDLAIARANNELWSFDTKTGLWTWLSGGLTTPDAYANYGTRGVGTASTRPGGRAGAAVCRGKGSDLVYLFGGDGLGDGFLKDGKFNDVWTYNLRNNIWTWVGGEKASNPSINKGTPNVESAATRPPGTSDAQCWVDDATGLVHVFTIDAGLFSSDPAHFTFNPATGNWAFIVNDSKTTLPTAPNTVGIEDPRSLPPAIRRAVGWKSGSSMFMYGGDTGDQGSAGASLWQYRLSTNAWTLLIDNGSKFAGKHGTTSKPNSGDKLPSMTNAGQAAVIAASGNVYVFGGRVPEAASSSRNNNIYAGFWRIEMAGVAPSPSPSPTTSPTQSPTRSPTL
ncbi:hypothetical protein HK105_209205, partial [Polyrhizophydium stewartii]